MLIRTRILAVLACGAIAAASSAEDCQVLLQVDADRICLHDVVVARVTYTNLSQQADLFRPKFGIRAGNVQFLRRHSGGEWESIKALDQGRIGKSIAVDAVQPGESRSTFAIVATDRDNFVWNSPGEFELKAFVRSDSIYAESLPRTIQVSKEDAVRRLADVPNPLRTLACTVGESEPAFRKVSEYDGLQLHPASRWQAHQNQNGLLDDWRNASDAEAAKPHLEQLLKLADANPVTAERFIPAMIRELLRTGHRTEAEELRQRFGKDK